MLCIKFQNWYKVKGKRDFAIFGFRTDNLYLNKRRRRELALLKAEPGKNWNSFETFIFVTLRGSSYKINQDPGREKSGRHFLKPFSRWPTSKIAKIKNKHNFGIINPMKLILVSNSFFEHDLFTCVLKNALRVHMTLNPIWPPPKRAKIENKYDRGIIELKKVIFVSYSMFLRMIYSLVPLKMHSEFTWPGIQYGRHPRDPKSRPIMNVVSLSSKRLSWCLIPCFFQNFGTIYSLVHLKNAHIVHMNWNPLWPPPKMAKMTNKGNFGIIESRKLIFVCNSMFVSVIYSLVHLKCTQNSHDLKSNMATIELLLSLMNWYSSQKILATNQTKGKMWWLRKWDVLQEFK